MKIWRYLDFAKFVSMLSTRTLYFACVADLQDPFEGWLPRSHIEAFRWLCRGQLAQLKSVRDSMKATSPHYNITLVDEALEAAEQKKDLQKLFREVNFRFGVSCCHINESESAAMWQLYGAAGSGIAIESSKERLQKSIGTKGVNIDPVRYMDFERDEIEKGYRHYGLFFQAKIIRA